MLTDSQFGHIVGLVANLLWCKFGKNYANLLRAVKVS